MRYDHTGETFGSLTVIGPCRDERGRLRWECRCACGGSAKVFGANLRTGNTTTCGCLRAAHPEGLSKTRLYTIWCGMIGRCKDAQQPNYGGRGIRVCAEWSSFERFHEWASASGYADTLSIDRIDNDGNYEPRNCRWVTAAAQAQNTSRTVRVRVDGQIVSLAEASRMLSLNYSRLQRRMRNSGLGFEEAVAYVRQYEKPNPGLNFTARRRGN